MYEQELRNHLGAAYYCDECFVNPVNKPGDICGDCAGDHLDSDEDVWRRKCAVCDEPTLEWTQTTIGPVCRGCSEDEIVLAASFADTLELLSPSSDEGDMPF